MQHAVGESFHGNLKVINFKLVLCAVDQLADAALLVSFNTQHIQLDQVHDLNEF